MTETTEDFEVVVGIYEGFVIGYRVSVDRAGGRIPKIQISRTFAGEFHTRSVRSLATGDNLLASGGADDRIRVYDLAERIEAKELFNHTGIVNSVVFVENGKYLISGGEDGKIVFTNTRNWQVDKEWEKAHKGAVRCIAVHPQETLALTIGADLVLKSWNLVTGRCVFSTNLKNKPQYGGIVENIRWSPDGEHFAVTGARIVEVLSLDSCTVVRSHTLKHRITDMCWIGEADLLIGQDNGEIFFFNIETEESGSIPAHDARLKAMKYVDGLLVTVSSAGELSFWSIPDDYSEIILLRTYNINCRPICVCVVESTKLGLTFDKLNSTQEENEQALETDEMEQIDSVAEHLNDLFPKQPDPQPIITFEKDEDLFRKIDKKSKRKQKKFKQPSENQEDTEQETFKGEKKLKLLMEGKLPLPVDDSKSRNSSTLDLSKQKKSKKKTNKKNGVVHQSESKLAKPSQAKIEKIKKLKADKFKKKKQKLKSAMQFEESDIATIETHGKKSLLNKKKSKVQEVKYIKKKKAILG